MSYDGYIPVKFGDTYLNFRKSEWDLFNNGDESIIGLVKERANMGLYEIEGIDKDLSDKVCKALYQKRQFTSSVTLDLDKMAEYFAADKEVLKKIIKWYEGNLIDTKFEY